jgi:uracil-DNA glycosylase family protein
MGSMARSSLYDASVSLPGDRSLNSLREAAQECRGCDLFRAATQAVFGEGPTEARVLLIGEQPGNEEDLKGHPFVGPAGRLLDMALEEAGIARSEIYVTNVVKHFKFEERGKRRIHKKPGAAEVKACQPWLEAEIEAVKPKIIVCLGATAAQSILGRDFRLTQSHGEFFEHPWAKFVTATLHPSAILRATESEDRHRQYKRLLEDLRRVVEKLEA